MMTAAVHIEVYSCAIEGFNLDAVNDLLQKRGLLEENEFSLSVMVAFGYRVRQGRSKKRSPMKGLEGAFYVGDSETVAK